ncbi:DUF294 nucleotidyltransferase-like domain-containing protein [Ureibacillus composti]
MKTYESIKIWKDENIPSFLSDSVLINNFHDQVMLKVLEVAQSKMGYIKPPCEFTWFITGSGGRFEQGVISDQDHGIIYEFSNEENDAYFRKLGEEISYGLDWIGYPFCKGNIMSSNPIWCKSLHDWQQQIQEWMDKESWEAIRYLQIFYDARTLFGKINYVLQLKQLIYQYQLEYPMLLRRFIANIMHLKNGIGPMGKIIVEQYGPYQGCVNLKYSAFLPYVNAIRLLSIKEGIYETSTLERMRRLIHFGYEELLRDCEDNFKLLLQYRLSLLQGEDYMDTHYIKIKKISKEDRKIIKRIIKDGKILHDEVIQLTLSYTRT